MSGNLKVADFNMWADSFHEGEWACRNIANEIVKQGGSFQVKYEQGFIPAFQFKISNLEIRVNVYGNYGSWSPKPKALEELLSWGKPDLVLVTDSTDEILMAVEETAATPTGNQALQRCERQFGSAIEGFPFWYLISEFGIHSDGGVRRDSVWPSLMGLEIMTSLEIPSIVLHYSDLENPEDYESGIGMKSLFKVMTGVLINSTKDAEPMSGLEKELQLQIDDMTNFIESTASNSLYFLPDSQLTKKEDLTKKLCEVGDLRNSHPVDRKSYLNWPLASELDAIQQGEQKSRDLKKKDPFAKELEKSIDKGQSYGIIRGSGSKPQKEEKMKAWISQQNSLQISWEEGMDSKYEKAFRLHLKDFPKSPTGYHVITAPRILYLFDNFSSVLNCLIRSFPQMNYMSLSDIDSPTLVYISNSVKPGRIFGDPYTGQIAAYATSFGALAKGRKVLAYFPHQSVAQALENFDNPNNKGLRIMKELTDYLVFGGGITLNMKTGEIL
jgi:hypothetical protein